MGTKDNPGMFCGYAKALPDEPYFVLLARDPAAVMLVKLWASDRLLSVQIGDRPETDRMQIAAALRVSRAMRSWRFQHDGTWRGEKDAMIGPPPTVGPNDAPSALRRNSGLG